jgi:thiol-disulfide isomerase/thioredoxin
MQRLSLGLVAAFVLLGAITGCKPDAPATTGIKKEIGSATAPEARAVDLEKAIKDQKGKVVLVDCWATWCPPCVKKFPHLVQTSQKYADKGLVCMGVCMDKYGDEDAYSQDKVLKFLRDKGADFPNLIVADPRADDQELKKLLGDYSLIPFMALFDRNGRRVWTSDERPMLTGEKLDAKLDAKIETLLAEQP